MTAESPSLLIIYGSQTGQSKSIAENVKLRADDLKYRVELLSMDHSIEKMPWKDYQLLVVITSSTGDGDPPENAIQFWKKLRSKDLCDTSFAHLAYALLGLGDSNYTTFCGFPRSVDKQFKKLGAKQIYGSGWADDGVGLENVVDPWIENLWEALEKKQVITQEDSQKAEVEIPEFNSQLSTPRCDSSVPATTSDSLGPSSSTASTIQDQTLQDVEEKTTGPESSLTISLPPLKDCDLKVPMLPQPFLDLKFQPEILMNQDELSYQNNYPLPSARSSTFKVPISMIRQITGTQAIKPVLQVTLDLQDGVCDYQPGDSIGILCPNSEHEVKILLGRLGIMDKIDVAYSLKVKPNLLDLKIGSKLKYEMPSYIPSLSTLRHTLTYCCEIRSVPRKALLRVLAEYTTCEDEKRRLLELSSLQGSDDYAKFIRQANVNVLDLLNAFPSCDPPIERLLEEWPRLLPRPYSISSSPLKDTKKVNFVFNVVKFPLEGGRSYERKGVATGWLEDIFNSLSKNHLTEMMQDLNIANDKTKYQLPIYFRMNTAFRLPSDLSTPLIFIGAGTGVAPYVGFLQHREEIVKTNPDLANGPAWLLYGCRMKDQDFLYREELQRLHDNGILTRLIVCFSRENMPPEAKYVQDLVRQYGGQLVRMVLKGGIIYVCGDAANMAKDVMKAFTDAVQSTQNITEEEAKKVVLQWQKEKKYLQDIWT